MDDLLDRLQDELDASTVPVRVLAISPFSNCQTELLATLAVNEAFNEDDVLVAAFSRCGCFVEWVQHQLYHSFNRTSRGVDEGGGKTWDVVFIPSEMAQGGAQ